MTRHRLSQFAPLASVVLLLTFMGCGTSLNKPLSTQVQGWELVGDTYTVQLASLPSSPMRLQLDLGSVGSLKDATIRTKVRNVGENDIVYNSIIQHSGAIAICPCEPGPTVLGAIPPGGCIQMKTQPAQNSPEARLEMGNLLDININATVPAGTPTQGGGLTFGSSCD